MTVMNTTVRFLRSAVPAHRRRSAILFAGAVVAVASAGSATGLFTTRGGLAAARMADAAPRPHAIEAAPADRAITEPFTRFALNALLVPLLDEQPRPHWTDAGMRFFCGPDTRVDVDGAPLVPGAPVPAGAFTVRWHIDRCWPLNLAAFELSGEVE